MIQRVHLYEPFRVELPASEVCMHMRVTDKTMWAVLIPSCWRYAVQLLDEDWEGFSAPILTGEAGVYEDQTGPYIHMPHSQFMEDAA